MLRLAAVMGMAIVISGCAGVTPQTRSEFVQANVDGVAFSMVDTHVANRSFEQVVKSLQQKSAECFDTQVTTRRAQGGMTTSNIKDEFRTTVRVVNRNKAELTTQFTSKGIVYAQKIPDGGFYHRAADIERLSPSTTKLTYYGSRFASSKAAWAAIKQWGDGQAADCPS